MTPMLDMGPLDRVGGSRATARRRLDNHRAAAQSTGMCRSIKTLRRADEPATETEIEAAALQFVRKISGYRTPSKRNAEPFEAAVAEIAAAARRLLGAIPGAGLASGG